MSNNNSKNHTPRGDIRGFAPAAALEILGVLEAAGFEAFFVGGCVRDCVMGVTPNDWDVTTSALPSEVKALFQKTFETGIQHGTVSVLVGWVCAENRPFCDECAQEKCAPPECVEVTTFRTDGPYSDSRRPDAVTFTPSLEEDLARRDFTINAMAWSPSRGLVDPFGGLEDIDARTIRTVGDPNKRFSEDALRMLRAVRFAASLGFEIEPATKRAVRASAHLITRISAERVRGELGKILGGPRPERIALLQECGLFGLILPELCEPGNGGVLSQARLTRPARFFGACVLIIRLYIQFAPCFRTATRSSLILNLRCAKLFT